MTTKKSLYVCTAIPYVNGQPHVGHALDYLLADTYFRYQTKKGNHVRFQAGTDEHGNKIWSKAQELGIPVEDYVTQNAEKFREFIKKLGVTPTDFIRTTDPAHERRCQLIWERLQDHIYPSTYEGWYCSGCERFITENEFKETNGVCPDHQKPYEKLSETNYYFRISDFKEQIRTAIEQDELKILPNFRKKEVLNLLADSPDVSVSRPKKNLSWGVPVPNDQDQVMYVWIDALANYITVLGYPEQDISAFWPASLQVVGKDILRFHAIIWPAMLLALGLPLPKVLLSHGHINVNGAKMSKSLGNVVDPLEVLDKYGLDPFRYFFLRHIDTFTDSDFTWEKFDTAYSSELANDLGNLVSRLATLCAKNHVSGLSAPNTEDQTYARLMDNFEFSKAFDYIWEQVQSLNRRIDEQKPWALAKSDPAAAQTCLSSLVADLLAVADLLSPFLPDTSQKISAVFTADSITPPAPLFPKA
ncbi:methionine--tRNA ligase [Candidatus Saccharibacteria bacterium]|nr:methionine--tRNA ligase [Candidatus Saccharibacteria bacterium]